ncbi:cytochrome P450 [Candidatus Poriferisocius sp.]|uniref:cytochrome P450 n=1 Tax=Candidatus Poriferisocius sp. TaxID=3101276 RepID=UPI003B5BC38A
MPTTADLNVTEPGLYLQGIPHDRFADLRAADGLRWHPYEDGGFWAVTRYADVRAVSRNPEVYSSAIGHTNLWDLEADALEARRSLIDTDAPDHTRLRRLVAGAFTPKNIRRWTDTVRDITGELLDRFVAEGGGDWVDMVAAPLPIRVILTMLGVPVEDADYLVELSNYLVEGTGDTQSIPPDAFGNTTELRLLPFNSPASHALFEYGEQMKRLRREDPHDDLVTHLVQAEFGGERLSLSEYRNMFHLLVFAGNETTRTAISHGAMALAAHPDEWQRVQDNPSLVEPATEEILRWATPILHMRRTAATDTELAGTPIAAGDKVVMWYASANRDDAVFDEPFRFDVGRANPDHLAFGGGGPHLCLGAFLARLEVSVLLEEMAKRSLYLQQTSEPVRARSNFVHGVLSVGMQPAPPR